MFIQAYNIEIKVMSIFHIKVLIDAFQEKKIDNEL